MPIAELFGSSSPVDTIVAAAALAGIVGVGWLAVSALAWRRAIRRATPRSLARLQRWTPAIARQIARASMGATAVIVVPACTAAAPGPTIEHVGAAPGGTAVDGDVPNSAVTTTVPVDTITTLPPPTVTHSPLTSASPSTVPDTTTMPSTTTEPPTAQVEPLAPVEGGEYPTEGREYPTEGREYPTEGRAYIVVSGDNFWSIAEDAAGPGADLRTITDYWRALLDANRHHIASGDPNLIHPGETLTLPTLQIPLLGPDR